MKRFASIYDPEHKRRVILGYLYDRGELYEDQQVVIRGFWLGLALGIAFTSAFMLLLFTF